MPARIHTDWPMFIAILVILAFGLVMVFSASSTSPRMLKQGQTWQPEKAWDFLEKQFAAAVVGLLLLFTLRRMDYQKLQHPLYVFLPINLLFILLIGVIFADPKAHRWYRLGSLQFQPSELAKPALVVFLAWFVARRENKINDRYTLLPAALVVGGLAGLIGYGDLGTAMVLLTPAVAVFFVAGIERRYFYLTLALAAVLTVGFIWQKPARIIRVTSFFGLTEQKIQSDTRLHWLAKRLEETSVTRDAEHQQRQAKLAIGSGGVPGVGLGQSTQKLGYLPEAHTDFIFGVIGEETGLVASMLLLGAYFFIFWRGLRLYWMTPDAFGRYLALGCVALVTSQAFFNMSVVLGLMPNKGIPLPLISYGGSAVLCTLITFGLLLSVSDRATTR
ncbi:MAG: putative peptidoglycan glycosyltransferase FtsW [Bryobacteraceae bacterium]|jgi:cell division protein FtsW